jgi:hypothetical protein
MLKLELVVNEEQWPTIVMTLTRESFNAGRVVVQERKQYDLAEVKAQEMVNNALSRLMQEIIGRRKR